LNSTRYVEPNALVTVEW